jgi:copper(I)-binding protein
MMLKTKLPLILMLCALSTWAVAEQAAQLELRNGWIRVGPPSQTVTAGYGELHNTGAEPITVVGARSPIARSTELHTMSVNAEGVMSMQEMPELVIEPGASVQFAPRGKHFMLIGLVGPMEPGRRYPLEILLQDGSLRTVWLIGEML